MSNKAMVIESTKGNPFVLTATSKPSQQQKNQLQTPTTGYHDPLSLSPKIETRNSSSGSRRERMGLIASYSSFVYRTAKSLSLDEKQHRQSVFVNRSSDTFSSCSVHGFPHLEPMAGTSFFPQLETHFHRRNSYTIKNTRVISVIIPCFNEKGSALRRSIDSLQKQEFPKDGYNFRIDIVVVVDGLQQIDQSMEAYLELLFGISVKEGDVEFNPFEWMPDANTIIVEPMTTDEPSNNSTVRLSLVVKRHHKGKINSHMWWLGCHARAVKCEFALATDCGIVFRHDAVHKMVKRMGDDKSVAAVSAYRRGMPAWMQGDGPNGWRKDPVAALLRQSFSVLLVQMNNCGLTSVQEQVGFLIIAGSSCELFRYKDFGSLAEGPMREYFSLTQRKLGKKEGAGLVIGNTQLAEDRFPSILLTFRTKEDCEKHNITHQPRMGYVFDSHYFFEAELPLSRLLERRRRWINGEFFALCWMLTEGWIWRSGHNWWTKTCTFVLIFMQLVQETLLRLFGPAIFAVSLFACFRSLLDRHVFLVEEKDPIPIVVMISSAVTGTYFLVFCLFVMVHTPRAVPVTEEGNSNHDSKKSGSSPTKLWKTDPNTAYRKHVFALAFVVNAVVSMICALGAVDLYLRFGWDSVPLLFRIITLGIIFPYVVFFLDTVTNRRPQSVSSFFHLICTAPFYVLFASQWFQVWFRCYATARLFDLTRGNGREGNDETSSTTMGDIVAMQRAKLGYLVSSLLLLVNFTTLGIVLYFGDVSIDGPPTMWLVAVFWLATSFQNVLNFIVCLARLSYQIVTGIASCLSKSCCWFCRSCFNSSSAVAHRGGDKSSGHNKSSSSRTLGGSSFRNMSSGVSRKGSLKHWESDRFIGGSSQRFSFSSGRYPRSSARAVYFAPSVRNLSSFRSDDDDTTTTSVSTTNIEVNSQKDLV